MELHLLIFMISLILFVGVSASTETPDEMYWKSVLADTPMPSAIKSSLQSVGNYGKLSAYRVSEEPTTNLGYLYKRGATRKEVDDHMKKYGQTFMLEKQMAPGRTIEVQLSTSPRGNTISTFLPRKVADSTPFSSDKLPQILDQFSVDPKSKEALAMTNTIKDCQIIQEPVIEDKTYCATSLEGMVTFVMSEFGNYRLNPLSSTITSTDNKKTEYKMTGVDKLADYGSPIVVCHRQDYPYAVFYCHDLKMAAAYAVSLASNKGMVNVKTLAICHKDTSWWTPKHLSFQMLKVKPGKTSAICHFVDDRSVVWTKKGLRKI